MCVWLNIAKIKILAGWLLQRGDGEFAEKAQGHEIYPHGLTPRQQRDRTIHPEAEVSNKLRGASLHPRDRGVGEETDEQIERR